MTGDVIPFPTPATKVAEETERLKRAVSFGVNVGRDVAQRCDELERAGGGSIDAALAAQAWEKGLDLLAVAYGTERAEFGKAAADEWAESAKRGAREGLGRWSGWRAGADEGCAS